MATGQMNDLLNELQEGKLDSAAIEFLAGMHLSELIANLRGQYPVRFQERAIGRKREVGMAQSIRFNLTPYRVPGSRFLSMHLRPVLQRCLLVSAYDDLISEVTHVVGIRIRPGGTQAGALVLKMGRGYKLDRDADVWLVKPIEPKAVTLSEDFLARRGWNFDALVPLWA